MSDEQDPVVPDTSQTFDDCIGKEVTELKPGSLADVLGMEDTPSSEEEAWKEHNYQNWREEWKGMPEFESKTMKPLRSLNVHFQTEEDIEKFQEVTGITLTGKTKSSWYPPREKDKNSLRRWLDESEV